MKKTFTKALCFGLIVSIVFSALYFSAECKTISDSVLRLHILANSDSADDQALKLKVRDEILKKSGELLATASTKEEAEQLTAQQMQAIVDDAQAYVYSQGYDYPVTASLLNMPFNTRIYGDIAMPAGNYDALRITIGEGKGHNWWCVMFPPICLPAAEEKQELSDVLDDEQLQIVENEPQYEIKFKFVEIYESIVHFFTGEK